MNETDLAWATGYIEADGHFGFHSGNGGATFRAIVSAYSTDLEPLIKLNHIFGGKVAVQKRRNGVRCPENGLGTKTLYRWNVYGLSAVEVIRKISPYLVLDRRRKSAEKISNFFDGTFYTGKRWTAQMRQEGQRLHEELKSFKEN